MPWEAPGGVWPAAASLLVFQSPLYTVFSQYIDCSRCTNTTHHHLPTYPSDLFNLVTHPDYRRRGVAQRFLDWGKARADELGLDLFLDATPMGRPRYLANGFVELDENTTDMRGQRAEGDKDAAWREMERRIPPFTFWLMWRPAGGRYEEGKTVRPRRVVPGE